MAFVSLTPVTWNIAVKGPYKQTFKSPVIKDSDGAPVDLSAWTSITMQASTLNPTPLATLDASGLTVIGDANGQLNLTLTVSQIADLLSNGICNITVGGLAAGGDTDMQILATGTLSVTGNINFS